MKTFGMWVPNTDPSGSGLIADARFRGQEGAAADAPMHSHLGVLGVTGFLMQDLAANPLDYVEGGALNARREEISRLGSTRPIPTCARFARRGGKMIVDHRHQRHARVARRAARLLPVGARQDGPRAWTRSRACSCCRRATTDGRDDLTIDGTGKTIPVVRLPATWSRNGSAGRLGRTEGPSGEGAHDDRG